MSAVGTVKIQILQPIVQEVEEKVTQPVAQTVYVQDHQELVGIG